MRTLFLSILLCAFHGAGAQYLADNTRQGAMEETFRRGEQAYRAGDHERAIQEYNDLLAMDSEHVNAYLQRAFCHAMLNHHGSAVKDLDQVIQRKSDHLWAYTCRSASLSKLGRHQESIADLDRVLELDPRNEEAFNDRGWSHKALGDMDAACRDWTTSRKMGNAEARIILTNNRCK